MTWIDAIHGSANLNYEIKRIAKEWENSLEGKDGDWIDENEM